MYTDWFKLQKLPFRLRPDPDFLYLVDETRLVHEALQAAVARRHGLVCLVGEAGVGKTTLLHAIARESQTATTLARIQQPDLDTRELLATLAAQLGAPLADAPSSAAQEQLAQLVAAEAGRGRTVLIQVDDAHRCTSQLLRELLDLCACSPAPLIMLAGEASIGQSLAALTSQAATPLPVEMLQLPRLASDQIAGYLEYRLQVAGNRDRILFDSDTIMEIMRYTGGTPQLINILCDSAMMLAAAHSTPRVAIADVRDAAQELNWVEFSARAAAPAGAVNPLLRAASAPAGTPTLEVLQEGRLLSRLKLRPGRLVVGRAADAGLRLDSQFVSREHCELITTADETTIEDLDSKNGIIVNGEPRRRHRLSPQDRIVIGDHTLVYLETP